MEIHEIRTYENDMHKATNEKVGLVETLGENSPLPQ